MTDLPMMLLGDRLSTTPFPPAGLASDHEGDPGQTFQSSLEELVAAVADDFLEEKVPMDREPVYTDQTTALMLLLVSPLALDVSQPGTMTSEGMPPPPAAANAVGTHLLKQDQTMSISFGVSRIEPPEDTMTGKGIAPPHDRSMLSDPGASRMEPPQDSIGSHAAKPASSPVPVDGDDAESTAANIDLPVIPAKDSVAPEVRLDEVVRRSHPRHGQPDPNPSTSNENPVTNSRHQDRISLAAQQPPSTDEKKAVTLDDSDATFLPPAQFAVRNPVQSRTRPEQTAFEVDLSEKVDKTPEPKESVSPAGAKPPDDNDEAEVHKQQEKRPLFNLGNPGATPDDIADAKLSHTDAGRANSLTPPPNTHSLATRDRVPTNSETERPAQQTASIPAELDHGPEKSKPFHPGAGLQLRVGPREDVSIRVNQIAGNVRIAVRSADPQLTRELQAGVPDLLALLNRTGVQADATIPDIGSPIAEAKESTVSNIANGSSGWSQESSRDANGDSSKQDRRHRRPEQQWQEWLEAR